MRNWYRMFISVYILWLQLYVLLISYICLIAFLCRLVCTWRWYVYKLGIFHANHTSIGLDPHKKLGEVGTVIHVEALQFFSYWPFQGGAFLWILFIICVSYHTVLSVPCSHVVICWERTVILALLYVTFSFVYVTSPYCGWIRCGIGLYGFLVFAFFLTLMAMTFHKCFMARFWYVINYFISLLIHIFNYSVPLCSYILEGLLCSWLGTLNILNCLNNSVY